MSAVENHQNVELFTVLRVLTALDKGLQIIDRHITLDLVTAAALLDDED